jgi:ATP-binding cassette subfamily F protein uup
VHAQLADPAFFRRPGEEIAKAQGALRDLEASIAQAYARWEALEARRVAIE